MIPTFTECARVPIVRSLRTVREGLIGTRSATRISAINPCSTGDLPSHLTWTDFPDENMIDETPVSNLKMTDIEPIFDTATSRLSVFCAGYWRDTAYLVKWSPEDESLNRLPVDIGHDNDSSGSWRPDFRVVGVFDCDFDGQAELFFYLNSVRDKRPRELICVEASPFRIAWKLPVASPVFEVHSCHDSVDPGILFVTAPPGQGASDEQFSDSWGYLVRVDTAGSVVFSKVISRYPIGSSLKESADQKFFYLLHRLRISADTSTLTNDSLRTYLSKIDSHGTILTQTGELGMGSDQWIDSWSGADSELVYLRLSSGQIMQFNRALQLTAVSDSCVVSGFLAWIPRFGGREPAAVLQENTDAVGIYDRHFRKLAEMPHFNTLEVLQRNEHGEVTALAACRAGGTYMYVRLERGGFWRNASIFYRTNQIYVVSVLFAALAAFVVSNFYRRRTKHNLQIISRQKHELEETHAALKEAQQTIIAQEKFRQAKDIAGGFAHEIRNALFPADGAMVRFRRLLGQESIDPTKASQILESIDTAVARAIGITEQISQYTKLDSLHSPEPVNIADIVSEVVRSNKARCETAGVTLNVSGDNRITVVCNRGQMFSVINNLVINSLDALNGMQGPSIGIEWSATGNLAELQVRDNGAGIPADNLARIFDTFYSTKPNSGTGLGLAIVKKTVEMYGGTVQVASQLNQGTTFTIRLNVADSHNMPLQKGESADGSHDSK